jgi:DNA primase
VRDLTGDVIAFGARKLAAEDDGPKYLNTPETPLFKKSSVLYGADLAKREIAQRRQAVVVEGYTDVMACHLAGVPTAVATSGTSFGDGHIKVLRRLLMDADWLRGEVIFTFDGDSAGRRASLRAFDMEERFVTQTFVAVQRDGLDPCDLRLKHGDAAVRDLVASRVPLYEFSIRNALRDYDLGTAEGRLGALDAAARFIARIKDDGLRKVYAYNLDRWLGLNDQELVLARVGQYMRRGQARPGRRAPRPAEPRAGQAGHGPGPGDASHAPDQPNAPDEPPYDLGDPVVQVEREALKLAIQRPALCGPAFDAIDRVAFTAPRHAAVMDLVTACGGTGGAGNAQEWAALLRQAAPDDRTRSFVTQLAVEPLRVPRADGEPDARYADAVLARVEELAVSRSIATVKSRLQRLNPVDGQAAYNRTFGDLVALEQRRKALLEKAAGAL